MYTLQIEFYVELDFISSCLYLNISSNLNDRIELMKTLKEEEIRCLISRQNRHMNYENEDSILNCILAWYNFSDLSPNVDRVLRENICWPKLSNKFLKDVLTLPSQTPILLSQVFKDNIVKEINTRGLRDP